MKVTKFIASAILAHCGAAVPVNSSSSLSNSHAFKNQTNTTISAHNGSHPTTNLIPTDLNDTKIRDLFEELPRGYCRLGGDEFSERWNIQNESPFKPRNHTITSLNSTRDGQEVQQIRDKLEVHLKEYHTNGWKYNSPLGQAEAIEEPENQLRRLCTIGDAGMRHGEKLRNLGHRIDGISHRKEAYAKGAGQRLVTSLGLNDNPSNTETAALWVKRAVGEEKFHSPMSQSSSVKSSKYEFTLAQCPGQPGYIPVEQIQDTARCALIHYGSKSHNYLRHQQLGNPINEDNPPWLRKLMFPKHDNSLPWKRDDSNWESEESMGMEFGTPEIHGDTNVHVDVDLVSDWKRDHSPTEQPIKRDRTVQEMTKLENDIEAKIKPFTELKNAIEEATPDGVEVFADCGKRDTSHSSGKTKLTTTIDPSDYHELDFSESVKELESEVAGGVRRKSKHITTPAYVLKNSADKDFDGVAYNATGIAVMHGKTNSTARFNTSQYYKRGIPKSVRKVENGIGVKITGTFDEVNKPFTELKNATDEHNTTLSSHHFADQKTAPRQHGHYEIAHDPKAIEYCRKHKGQFVKAKDSPSGHDTFCNKGYPITTPEDEFEQVHNHETFVKYISEIADKYQAHSRYDQDKVVNPEEEDGMRRMIKEQYEREGFDPSTFVSVTPADANQGN